jgi:hypothetical protein
MAKKKQIEALPSNSNSSRVAPVRPEEPTETREERIEEEGALIEEPKPRRNVRGKVIQRKKTLTQSIAETLVGNGTNSVGGYIVNDVLIPALKNLISDAVTSGIEMVLYGETSGRKSRGGGRDRDKTVINYSGFSRRDRDDDRRERRRPTYHGKFDLDEIYFKDHVDAEEVLDELCDRLEEYEEVSVADYFELAGIDGVTHAHYKWGWTDLKRARNTHTRHGWAIILPEPEPLD